MTLNELYDHDLKYAQYYSTFAFRKIIKILYRVYSWNDFQDGCGAIIRTKWRPAVQPIDESTWVLRSLTFD